MVPEKLAMHMTHSNLTKYTKIYSKFFIGPNAKPETVKLSYENIGLQVRQRFLIHNSKIMIHKRNDKLINLTSPKIRTFVFQKHC